MVLEQIEKKPEISRKELAHILGINPFGGSKTYSWNEPPCGKPQGGSFFKSEDKIKKLFDEAKRLS